MALSRSRTVTTIALIVALVSGVAASVVLAPEAEALASIATLTVVDGAVLVRHGVRTSRPRPLVTSSWPAM